MITPDRTEVTGVKHVTVSARLRGQLIIFGSD